MKALPSVAGSLAISVAAVGVFATSGEAPAQVAAGTRPAAAHVSTAPPSAEGKPAKTQSEPPSAQGQSGAGAAAAGHGSAEPRTSRGGSRGALHGGHGRDADKAKHKEKRRHDAPPRPRLTPAEIARAIGASESDVARQWPLIQKALAKEGMTDLRTQIAALATIVTEVGSGLHPINEQGGPSYFTQMYEWRSDLGNSHAGDGARYHGRGYIQLTGRANYRAYGAKLGLPLEQRPDLALRPYVAARILAAYFRDRHIDNAAQQSRWGDVRLRVNGGYNGWSRYSQVVTALLRAS